MLQKHLEVFLKQLSATSEEEALRAEDESEDVIANMPLTEEEMDLMEDLARHVAILSAWVNVASSVLTKEQLAEVESKVGAIVIEHEMADAMIDLDSDPDKTIYEN